MPDWCYNRLIVSGDHRQLRKFVDRVKNTYEPRNEWGNLEEDDSPPDFSLFALLPDPEGLSGDELIDWRYENWGTCREATLREFNLDLDEKPPYADYDFHTAGGPPVAWLEQVAALFPRLVFDFDYRNPNAERKGEAVAEGGKLVSHAQWIDDGWEENEWDDEEETESE